MPQLTAFAAEVDTLARQAKRDRSPAVEVLSELVHELHKLAARVRQGAVEAPAPAERPRVGLGVVQVDGRIIPVVRKHRVPA